MLNKKSKKGVVRNRLSCKATSHFNFVIRNNIFSKSKCSQGESNLSQKATSRPDFVIRDNFFSKSKRSTSRLEQGYLNQITPCSKRSQGHVEVILSFALFMGVLIFIFMFINPLSKTEKMIPIDDVQNAIISEASSEIGKLSVIMSNLILEENYCYYVSDLGYGDNFREVGDINNPRKFTIFFSDIFSENTPNRNNVDCLSENYKLGVYSKKEMVVWEKIEELKGRYESNYDDLKSSLGINNNFMFSFKDLQGNKISELSVSKDAPVGVDVNAKEFPVIVIDKNANIYELIMNLKVWE